MEVISTQLGRLVLILNLDELLPQSGTDVSESLPMLKERYRFASAPSLQDSIEKAREQGFQFKAGSFKLTDDKKSNIQDFTIWRDGLVVNAYTTEEAEAFLSDFFTWGVETLGLRVNPDLKRTRAYFSEIVVKFGHPIDRAMNRFEAISNSIQEALQKTYENDFPTVQISAIGFDYDRAKALNAIADLASFRLERRLNHPYSDDIYLSQAPLRTEDHIHLLENFEILLQS